MKKQAFYTNIPRVLFNLIFWCALFTFVLGVRYYDIGKIAFLNLPVEIPTYRIFVNGFFLGLLVGVFYSLVETQLEALGIYDNSLGKIILLRTLYLFIVSGSALALAAYLNFRFDIYKGTIDPQITGYAQYIFSATVKFLFLAALLGNFTLSIFHTLKSKIGSTEFRNLLLGLYRTPKAEERVFLFLDLKGSTTLAENLGHQKYSKLIQRCFRDLTQPLMETQGEVYQYVGDEVVITWPLAKGLTQANCLKLYFHFADKLKFNEAYYLREFGVLPFFKAGANMGIVTVVEVGMLKRAIVYHSDVLNTAARIQALCNQYDEAILISEDLKNQLSDTVFTFKRIGDILLRGKTQEIGVYAVHKAA